MRVQDFQQGLGEQGEVVIQPFVDASRKEGKRLDEALDVRVVAHVSAELQAPGDLGVLPREITSTGAQESKLALVVRKEVVHELPGCDSETVPCRRETRLRDLVA